jgi:DnaJ-class molecular chaperone
MFKTGMSDSDDDMGGFGSFGGMGGMGGMNSRMFGNQRSAGPRKAPDVVQIIKCKLEEVN